MAQVERTRWRCPDCGGCNVHNRGWINPNTDEVASWDDDYWCEDCEENVKSLEYKAVAFEVCGSCQHHKWGSRIPLPGVVITADDCVEKCDDCGIYDSDMAAAKAVVDEADKRDSGARVRICLEGYDAVG